MISRDRSPTVGRRSPAPPTRTANQECESHLIDLLPAGPDETPRGGVDHIALSVRCDDLGKVAEELRRRGVTVDGDVVQRRGAFGTGPSLYIRDPDGYRPWS